MTTTTQYNIAVSAIREFSDRKQAELDQAAAKARAACVAAFRRLALEGINTDSPAFPVASLLSSTLTIGRDDGYPAVNIPESTKAVILAALNAGILRGGGSRIKIGKLEFYDDFSGTSPNPDEWGTDYAAWKTAKDYRHSQTVSKL